MLCGELFLGELWARAALLRTHPLWWSSLLPNSHFSQSIFMSPRNIFTKVTKVLLTCGWNPVSLLPFSFVELLYSLIRWYVWKSLARIPPINEDHQLFLVHRLGVFAWKILEMWNWRSWTRLQLSNYWVMVFLIQQKKSSCCLALSSAPAELCCAGKIV